MHTTGGSQSRAQHRNHTTYLERPLSGEAIRKLILDVFGLDLNEAIHKIDYTDQLSFINLLRPQKKNDYDSSININHINDMGARCFDFKEGQCVDGHDTNGNFKYYYLYTDISRYDKHDQGELFDAGMSIINKVLRSRGYFTKLLKLESCSRKRNVLNIEYCEKSISIFIAKPSLNQSAKGLFYMYLNDHPYILKNRVIVLFNLGDSTSFREDEFINEHNIQIITFGIPWFNHIYNTNMKLFLTLDFKKQ